MEKLVPNNAVPGMHVEEGNGMKIEGRTSEMFDDPHAVATIEK